MFSTIRFSVEHEGRVSASPRQQTYCATNLEQGGGEVPAPLVLRKQCYSRLFKVIQGTTGETLERPSR